MQRARWGWRPAARLVAAAVVAVLALGPEAEAPVSAGLVVPLSGTRENRQARNPARRMVTATLAAFGTPLWPSP